jgi:hypothetical protein
VEASLTTHAPNPQTNFGYTKAKYLTDKQIDQILHLVAEGLPLAVAAREGGTSSHQFTMRANREPELKERLDRALEDGNPAFQESLRAKFWWHIFVDNNYKALKDAILMHTPEGDKLRTNRFEIGNTDGEALKVQYEIAFGHLSTAELRDQLAKLESGEIVDADVIELPRKTG